MRVQFSFTGGSGHALPMVPFATVLAERGHEVVFTCQPGMVDAIRTLGFDAVASGGLTLAAAAERRPLVALDRAREIRVMRDVFAGSVARERAPKIIAVAEDFGADVVVHDEVDFGAAAAARRFGVPNVPVVVLAAGGMITPGLLDEPLRRLCLDLSLPAETGLLDAPLTLAPVMPTFRFPHAATGTGPSPSVQMSSVSGRSSRILRSAASEHG